ncbi:unnamed protein product, partial [Ectocarpus sp. 12 AP-2014]
GVARRSHGHLGVQLLSHTCDQIVTICKPWAFSSVYGEPSEHDSCFSGGSQLHFAICSSLQHLRSPPYPLGILPVFRPRRPSSKAGIFSNMPRTRIPKTSLSAFGMTSLGSCTCRPPRHRRGRRWRRSGSIL